jgi:hypothetical protein
VSRSFELFQLASVRTFQQHVRTPLSVRSAMDFFPRHRYGKIATTVRTMWIPVRTRSSIRQVMHSKSRRPDVSVHGPDAHASYMEIAYIRSTVRKTDPMVRTRQALLWKLRATEVRPSGRSSNQERISANFGKPIAQLSIWTSYDYRPDDA